MAIPTITTGGNVVSADGTLAVPTKTGQANKVLKVNSGATGVEWGTDAEGGWTEGDASTDVVLTTGTDSVGIGTDNPASKLHVETASSHCAITLKRSEQGTGDVGLNMEGGTGGKIWYVIQQAGSDDLTFWDSNGDAARVTYKSGGNVGIGVTDPDTPLEVFDTSAQLKLSYNAGDNCTLGVDDYGMLTVTPSGGTINNTAANGVINSAALRSKGAHTHPDTFVKNTHLPTHTPPTGTVNNWLYVSSGKYSNSQLTAPAVASDAIRLIKWQPASAYTDTHIYLFILPTLDATWSSSSNYVKYRIVIQQDTAMGSINGVQVALQGETGSDTINGSTSDYAIQNIGTTAASAYDWTCDVVGYFDGSKTIWEVVQKAQWS